jgi:hypothetical protein
VQSILSSLGRSLTIIPPEVAQYTALCVQPKQANGYSDGSTEYRDHNDTVRDRLRVIEVRGHSRRRRHCSNGAPAINHLSQDEWWVSESKLIGRRELLRALLDDALTPYTSASFILCLLVSKRRLRRGDGPPAVIIGSMAEPIVRRSAPSSVLLSSHESPRSWFERLVVWPDVFSLVPTLQTR